MTPELRSRNPKLYLSGIDWFVRALDWRTRCTIGVGNQSQIVLVLHGVLDHAALRRRLSVFLAANPILFGRCRRNGFNLAPYWSVARSSRSWDLCLEVSHLSDNLNTKDVLHEFGGTVSQSLIPPLSVSFRVVFHGRRTYVGMLFNHQLLDAVGAESLLLHVSEHDDLAQPLPLGDRSVHLNRWRDKFKSGRVFNREMIALLGEGPPVALPLPAGQRRQTQVSRFAFRTYSAAETERIRGRAERCTGYLLLLPYLLGVSVHALHAVCRRMGLAHNNYVIPISVRHPPDGSDSIFFNDISFQFYRFREAIAVSRTALYEQAVEQMYAQVKKRLAHHVANAAMLMRILPTPWLARAMTLPLAGSMGSMSFSLVGQTGYTSNRFMGLPVENVYHMPRVAAPPGIGVVFTRYRDQLTLALSYLDGMLDESAVSMFMNDIDAALKGDG